VSFELEAGRQVRTQRLGRRHAALDVIDAIALTAAEMVMVRARRLEARPTIPDLHLMHLARLLEPAQRAVDGGLADRGAETPRGGEDFLGEQGPIGLAQRALDGVFLGGGSLFTHSVCWPPRIVALNANCRMGQFQCPHTMLRHSFVFRLVLLLILTPIVHAETRSGLMLRPMAEDRDAQLEFEIDQYAESQTDAGVDFDMRVFAARGRARLAPKMGWKSPRVGWEVLYIDTETPDPRIPDNLNETSVAFGTGIELGEWLIVGTLGVGFAGDHPYTGRGYFGLASINATKSFGKRDHLVLGVDFDGNRPIFPDIPLPVVLWTRVWNEQVQTSIGFPYLAVNWTPTDWFTLDFQGIPGVYQTGSLTFHVAPKWDLFLRYRGANFRFFIDDFSDDNDRLFYSEQRVEFGATWHPTKMTELKLFLAWAFDREFSTGFDTRDTDTLVRLDKSPAIGLSFKIDF